MDDASEQDGPAPEDQAPEGAAPEGFDELGDAVPAGTDGWADDEVWSEPAAPGPDRSTRSRQSLGIWIGVGLGVVVVGAVLAFTLASGSSDQAKREATTTTTLPDGTPKVTVPREVTAVPIPDGDYTAFCDELAAETKAFSQTDQVDAVREAYQEVDFAKLIAAAPEGLRPSLELLRDAKENILNALVGVDSMADLSAADYPQGFLEAFGLVGRAAQQKCPGLVGGNTPPTTPGE